MSKQRNNKLKYRSVPHKVFPSSSKVKILELTIFLMKR